MTINPLTMRLKVAKRELLALKTAHTRGLGNVRIYTSTITIDPTDHTTGIWDLVVNIDFDQAFVAYPFVNFASAIDSNNNHSLEVVGQDYTNGGYSLRAQFVWRYRVGTNTITVYSTAPVINYSYEWLED